MRNPIGLHHSLAILVLAGLAAWNVKAEPNTPLTIRLDSIARANLEQDRAVGAVVAVVRGDDTLFFETYGRMDVDTNMPMEPDAVFGIGSITKQFTAAAILKLRDQGRLSLEDDISTWLPDFDTRGQKVPLRRLLDHTSGIPDVTTGPEFRTIGRSQSLPRETMYELIASRPFVFPTGTAQIYSNSAFWLLHLVIEKASGMSYQRYLEDQIFEPLGMTRSSFCLDSANVSGRATGHRVRNGAVHRTPQNVSTWYLGSGALCSTASDLVTWLQELHGGKVLSPESYAEMIEPATLSDGTKTRYAMGLEVREDSTGATYIGHSGEITGYAARANWYPEAQMAIVVLMNNSGDASPSALVAALAAEVLPATPRPSRTFRGDPAPLVGTYKGPARDGDLVVTVRQKRQGLAVSVGGSPARLLSWVEGDTFQDGSALLSFRRASGQSGPATAVGYDAWNGYYILERLTMPAAVLARTTVFIERFWPLLLLGLVIVAVVPGFLVLRYVYRRLRMMFSSHR